MVNYVSAKERLSYELGEPQPNDVQSKWEKMSKSKGNVIDPLEIISEYGTDAMRFALTSTVTHARQIDLDRRRFEEYKNFANKLWNGCRFIALNFEMNEKGSPALTSSDLEKGIDKNIFTLDDKWILSRLNRTIQSVNDKIGSYHFSDAAKEIYQFFWDEFCAYYLELTKPYLFGKAGNDDVRSNKQKLLLTVLLASVRLMHPIVPFITEEIFGMLKDRFEGVSLLENLDPYTTDLLKTLTSKACIVAPYPENLATNDISTEVETEFNLINEVVYGLRNIRAELQIPPGNLIDVYLIGEDTKTLELIYNNRPILAALVRINHIESSHKHDLVAAAGATAIVKGIKIFVPLPTELKEKEKLRLSKELDKLAKQLESLQNKLKNPDFLSRAPEELVIKTKLSLTETEHARSEIHLKLTKL